MAARNRKGLSENTRLRIKTSMIQERLEKHILGEVEMTATQVRAAEILLNKTLPNLSAVELSGEINTGDTNSLTESEILARLDSLRGSQVTNGTTEADESEKVTH